MVQENKRASEAQRLVTSVSSRAAPTGGAIHSIPLELFARRAHHRDLVLSSHGTAGAIWHREVHIGLTFSSARTRDRNREDGRIVRQGNDETVVDQPRGGSINFRLSELKHKCPVGLRASDTELETLRLTSKIVRVEKTRTGTGGIGTELSAPVARHASVAGDLDLELHLPSLAGASPG